MAARDAEAAALRQETAVLSQRHLSEASASDARLVSLQEQLAARDRHISELAASSQAGLWPNQMSCP